MQRSITRRRFLAGAASLARGALVSPNVSVGSYRANEQVGVAVVGVSGGGSWFVDLLERDAAMRGGGFVRRRQPTNGPDTVMLRIMHGRSVRRLCRRPDGGE